MYLSGHQLQIWKNFTSSEYRQALLILLSVKLVRIAPGTSENSLRMRIDYGVRMDNTVKKWSGKLVDLGTSKRMEMDW